MVILIPAYKPGETLVKIAEELLEITSAKVLVVDDGSGKDYEPIFYKLEEMGARVHHLKSNSGKGMALKAGIKSILDRHEDDAIICVDADGQHKVKDIKRLIKRSHNHEESILLGVRAFDKNVPLRSKFGNSLTSLIFMAFTGKKISDTQTGLRVYPKKLLPWLLQVKGERYEYELNVLLKAVEEKKEIIEVPIETVYEDGNNTSHFRPVRDSIRIYLPLLKYGISSIGAGVMDFVLFAILSLITNQLWIAVFGARIISATFNFMVNQHWVFEKGTKDTKRYAIRYGTLALISVLANYAIIAILTYGIGMPRIVAKIITEIILFCANFIIQKRIVFRIA